MRLDKYLSNNTPYSRKDIKRLMTRGAVTLNGERVKSSRLHIGDEDVVCLFGEEVEARQPRYLMMHKPPGCVSATHDDVHMSALDLVEEPFHEDLHIAGRLDLDTTGLLLITDDGVWSQRITSPKHKVPKTYLVETADAISDDTATRFQEGVYLRYEDITTQPAELDVLDAHHARLTIYEGKYHQVKRMFAVVGNKVTALHRERIGPIVLDDELEPGEYRPLSEDELNALG